MLAASVGPMPASEGTHRRMLDALVRANAVDHAWAEATIAGTETLEDLERAVAGTGDNAWRIRTMNGPALVDEARRMAL